jgi:predicted PurR-regulated permease PerM
MPDRRITVDVRWGTILKLITAAVLVWVWLQVYELVLVIVVAVLLAVTLNPIVTWVERRGPPRWAAAIAVSAVAFGLVAGFFWITWSSLNQQAEFVKTHFGDIESVLMRRLPAWVREAFLASNTGEMRSDVAPLAVRLAHSTISALVVTLLASIVTVYLLIEGRRTRDWLLAFVPRSAEAKTEQTLTACETAIFGYVAGNVATSIFATLFVLIALSLLNVPAALLLALLAGVFDFVPVLGFILSAVPAILVATSVSDTTAVAVALLYVAYHAVENYAIAPRVYGDRLRLSNLAVILSFAVGAELAGVIGALIALPLAAMYPTIERIWLKDRLGQETVREHRKIERRKAG